MHTGLLHFHKLALCRPQVEELSDPRRSQTPFDAARSSQDRKQALVSHICQNTGLKAPRGQSEQNWKEESDPFTRLSKRSGTLDMERATVRKMGQL